MLDTATMDARLYEQGVMVIDDSAVQRQSAINHLEALGICKTWVATDGLAALQMLQKSQCCPMVVLVDLEMPGMDGIEFLQQLSTMTIKPAVAVVSSVNQSILNSIGIMVEALDLPLLGVIPKPLTGDVLRKTLKGLGALAQHHKGFGTQAPSMVLSDFADALQAGRVLPYYQPKVCLATGAVKGLEALARCKAADQSIVMPGAFIDLAEKHALMDDLTLCILQRVLNDLKGWNTQGFFPTVSLNVSAASIGRREVGSEIMRLVEESGIPPSAITFEITESALVSELAVAIGTVGRMRLKGFGLSLDDFGTGFSSLQQLSRLPFTEIKIDRSFVSKADLHDSRLRLLSSAVSTGEKLNLVTVAEGVETEGELALLKKLGCKQIQGYLVSKPMPMENVLPWFDQNHARLLEMCFTRATV